jgi:preprotein translocase subunit SecE
VSSGPVASQTCGLIHIAQPVAGPTLPGAFALHRRGRRHISQKAGCDRCRDRRQVPDQERETMATTNPLQFIQQTRAEVSKISWPSRREVILTTVMVFILAVLAATFFFLVDLVIRTGLTEVLAAF